MPMPEDRRHKMILTIVSWAIFSGLFALFSCSLLSYLDKYLLAVSVPPRAQIPHLVLGILTLLALIFSMLVTHLRQ